MEMFWADTPNWVNVLFMGGRFMDAWPFTRSNITLAEKLNAMTRFVIYVTLLVSGLDFFTGDRTRGFFTIFIGLVTIGAIVLLYNNNNKNKNQRSVVVVPDVPVSSKPKFLDGVKDLVNNPYGNPMPYEPGIAVRSSKPPMQLFEDNCLAAMYRGTDEWDEHYFFNQIPDPTLMARPVFWPQDPQPDIVSNEAACGDRKCR